MTVVEADLARADETAELLGARSRRIGIGLGHDDHELFAAIAADEVDAPDVAGQHFRDLAQHEVAGHVTVGVVDPLEVVQVDQHDRARPLVAGGPLELVLEPGQQRLPVERTGQQVDRRESPGLAHPLGEAAEAGPQPCVVDLAGVDLGGQVRGRGEPVGQLEDPAHLAATDRGSVAGRSDQGADQGDGQDR